MIKILFIHQYYYPEMTGTGRRTREMAEELSQRGYDCAVLTTYPREYRSFPDEGVKRYEILNGVRVYRINTFLYVNRNVITRLLSYALHFILVVNWLLKHGRNYDMIISVAPLSSGIAGAFAQKFLGIPHHFDVPDILPDLGIAANMIKNKYLIGILFKIESWVYKNSTTISPITYGQIQNIHNKKVPLTKLYYIPDWIDINFFKKNTKRHYNYIRKLMKIKSSEAIISFVGNIGALQGVDTFLEVVKLLNMEEKIKFIFFFIGDGIMLPQLKKIVEREKIQNVQFIGRVRRQYVPAYMNISNILVANYVNNNYMDICIPGKIFEYIISNTPIVIGARGEAANLINIYNAGLAVEPSNPREMKNAIIKILENPEEYKANINNFRKDYSLKTIIDKYDELIRKIYIK